MELYRERKVSVQPVDINSLDRHKKIENTESAK
jgi:hypothetical protein